MGATQPVQDGIQTLKSPGIVENCRSQTRGNDGIRMHSPIIKRNKNLQTNKLANAV